MKHLLLSLALLLSTAAGFGIVPTPEHAIQMSHQRATARHDENMAASVELQGSPEIKRNLSQLVPVTFKDVRYTVKVKKAEKVILDGLSGVMPAGRMTALMGPSGSGKTTLLDVLAGRKTSGAIEGEVLFAGQKLARGALRNLTGYVEQFDTLIGELSVKQMLMYTAELKLPPATSRADKEARVQHVITKLGLEGCADTTIGNVLQRGISGGQAKRVNIALALITQPRVLFLDEPTSGLDSHMANEVVQSLHALLAEGRTIVCTIHSPTSKAFALFDDLLVLKEGKLAFGGPLNRVEPYFEALGFGRAGGAASDSLPEWLVDVMEGSEAAEQAIDFAEKYAASTLCGEMQAQREADLTRTLTLTLTLTPTLTLTLALTLTLTLALALTPNPHPHP